MKRFVLVLAALVLVPSAAVADKKLAKSGSWDCTKDPVVHIGNGKGNYKFKGACTTISVGGGKNKLKIESVDTLEIGGAMNEISIGTVGTIDVGGAMNKITWKKAKTGDAPELKGQPDTITQAK